MIRHSFLLLSALLVMAFAASLSAQQQRPPAAQPAPTPSAPAAGQTVALPMSKMAVIYTDLFLDSKTGIAKFTAVVNKLNLEFKAPKDELNGMQTRAQTL